MPNLLKVNEDGEITRVCNYPDRDGKKLLYNDCWNCTHRTKCNSDIVERLAAYENTGLEPDIVAEYRKFEDELVRSGYTFGKVLLLIERDKFQKYGI